MFYKMNHSISYEINVYLKRLKIYFSGSPRSMDEHEITLQSFLSFSTGLSRLPPTGLDAVNVTFDFEVNDGALPAANTCGCVLILPVYEEMIQKNTFNEKMDKAILYAGGMHSL